MLGAGDINVINISCFNRRDLDIHIQLNLVKYYEHLVIEDDDN